MAYVELYNKDILDLVSVGKTVEDFNPSKGDYIKVEIYNATGKTLHAVSQSNKLLLRQPDSNDNYHLGDYHYHPEDPSMGFCSGKEHTENSISGLIPISVDDSVLPIPINSSVVLKKQVEIFRDDNGNIYIKPNEIIKLYKNSIGTWVNNTFAPKRGKYIIRIHFLRNIKSLILLL